MNRLDRFVNLLFLLASLCNTLFCVHRFARRRTIAKRRCTGKVYLLLCTAAHGNIVQVKKRVILAHYKFMEFT